MREAEARWRVVMSRQSELRGEIDGAKAAMKEMLATLVDRLGLMMNATGDYCLRVEEHAVAIKGASAIDDLVSVVNGLLVDTGAIQESAQHSRRDLETARGKAQGLENRVHELELELASISEMVRTDPLTKTLNRRGLDEMFIIEQARGKRDDRPLCVAILDIDDFKKLNDSRGHDTGDRALQYLTDCMRSALRPTDIISRFGGEEFVLLLPATDAREGAEVLTRLQRHLTKEMFLHNDDRVLITFSAGITEYQSGEEQDAAIGRADRALYRAKAAGKNRVLIE
jgi:diguanylate cyclase